MAAHNTLRLANELDAISAEIGKILDHIEMETPPAISGPFHDALVSVGMPESSAGEYSIGLRHSLNELRSLMEAARKELGTAVHIATNAPARAIKLSPPNSPHRRSGSLDL